MADGAARVLAYTFRLAWPIEIDERLEVYDDGGVWYWSLRPAEEAKRDRAGTFTFHVDDAELRELEALADEVDAEPAVDATQPRGSLELVVSGRSGSQLLSRSEPLSPTLERAREVGLGLRARAESAPLAVVRVSWRPLEPELHTSRATSVFFECENVGVVPVDVVFEPQSFMLLAVVDGGAEAWWQAGPNGTMGLTDDLGRLLGGITSPARLEPGEGGSALFLDALRPRRPGRVPAAAVAEGRLSLRRPGGSAATGPETLLLGEDVLGDAGVPDGPFRVETPLRELEIVD